MKADRDPVRRYVIRAIPCLLFLGLAVNTPGCLRVRTSVEPIDINLTVTLKVERELDGFFDELDTQDETLTSAEPAKAP